MKKSILAVLVVILAIFGGIMTVMSLAPVGQGEVGGVDHEGWSAERDT